MASNLMEWRMPERRPREECVRYLDDMVVWREGIPEAAQKKADFQLERRQPTYVGAPARSPVRKRRVRERVTVDLGMEDLSIDID